MNEQLQARTANPFQSSKGQLTTAANAESERAIQEVQASLVIAKKFPRDEVSAMDRILNACTRPSLAAQSLYSYAKGGTDITGPSIRLAEAIAQNWGNMTFGVKEIGRYAKDGMNYSEVEAYAWDLETNTRKPVQFVVKHWRDTTAGGYALKIERDIYELVANQAARRLRSCILAIIPGDVTEAAQNQCEATMAADADTTPEAQKKIVEAFEKVGVMRSQIEKLIQRRMDAIQPAQVIRLRKILLSIRDGMSLASDWFDAAEAGETVKVEGNPFKGKAKPDAAPAPAIPAEELPLTNRQTVTFLNLEKKEGTTEKGKPYTKYILTYDNGMAEFKASTFSKTVLQPLDGLAFGTEVEIETTPAKKAGYEDTLTFVSRIGGVA